MTARLLGPNDEPRQSGAVVAVHFGDYRRLDAAPSRAAGRRGSRSDQSESRFRECISSAGGTILEESWLGAMYKHRVRCSAGHECEVIPNSATAKRRRGFCRVCARQDPATAEAAFRARIAELGGTVIEPAWLGSIRPHRIVCALGHESAPIPGNLTRGQGPCRRCAGNDSAEARQRFLECIDKMGWTLVAQDWNGVDALHGVRCAAGHLIEVRPSGLSRAKRPCAHCAGRTPEAMMARFRGGVAALGGVVLEDRWLGNNKRYRVRCREGHITTPRPHHVLAGVGICHVCKGRIWDVFYVVVNPETATLKFGITSGNPRARLTDHAHDGFRDVVLLLAALGDGLALTIERAVRKALRAAGNRAVRGHEYFRLDARHVVFETTANVLARGPVTLLVAGNDETYLKGWRAGRRALWQDMESVAEDDPPQPRNQGAAA